MTSLLYVYVVCNALQDEEAAELSKMMMGKKAKRLYGRMQHGIEKKKAAVDALEEKRRAIESAKSSTSNKKAGERNRIESGEETKSRKVRRVK